MVNKKYQIFISSTYLDLKEERDTAIKTILSLYHIPIGMEMFSAGDDEQWGVISRTIDTSDYYIVIIGERYGSTTDTGISYTEKEYDYAVSKGIPVLAFIKEGDSFTASSKSQVDQKAEKRKFSAFREKAKLKYADFWTTKEELSAKLSPALYKTFIERPRTGWIRAAKEQGMVEQDGFVTATIVEYKRFTQNNTIPYHAYKLKEQLILGRERLEGKAYWVLHVANANFHLTASDKIKFKPSEIVEDTDTYNGDRVFIASDLWAVDMRLV